LAQQHVIQALHSSGVGGHSGVQATYHRIKALFSWPKMKETIRTYVQECSICQQAKAEHVKTPGLLVPLPVPKAPWTVVCLDFVEGLPLSNKKSVIMVIIDKFSNQVWQQLFKPSDTQLLMSSSYHPQTDGQTERLNQCLEAFLRCIVHSCPT